MLDNLESRRRVVPADQLITADRETVTCWERAAKARKDQRCSITVPASAQGCRTVAGFGQTFPKRCDIDVTAAYDLVDIARIVSVAIRNLPFASFRLPAELGSEEGRLLSVLPIRSSAFQSVLRTGVTTRD